MDKKRTSISRVSPYSRSISPSALKTASNPINFILKRTIYQQPKTGPVIEIGTSIHSVLEEAFKTISEKQEYFKRKNITPGGKEIEKIVSRVASVARSKLAPMSGDFRMSEFKYAKDMIEKYGSMILEDPTLSVFVETPMSSKMFSDQFLVRAVPDLMIVKNLRKEQGKAVADAVSIVDWKSFADELHTDFVHLGQDPQKRILTTLASQTFNTERVDFTFEINKQALEIFATRDKNIKEFLEFNLRENINSNSVNSVGRRFHLIDINEEIDRIRYDVEQYEELLKITQDYYQAFGSEGIPFLLKRMTEGPIYDFPCGRQCRTCYVRELCPYSDFIQSRIERGYIGEPGVPGFKSETKRSIESDEFKAFLERTKKSTEFGLHDAAKKFSQRVFETAKNQRLSMDQYRNMRPILMESYKKLENYSRNAFMHRFVTEGSELPPLMPFSITDRATDFGYLDHYTRTLVEDEIREYTDVLLETIGLGQDEKSQVKSLIGNDILKDRYVAGNLIGDIYENASRYASSYGLYFDKLPEELQEKVLRDPALILTPTTVLRLYGRINEKVLGLVAESGLAETVKNKLGEVNAAKVLQQRSLEAVFGEESLDAIKARAKQFLGGLEASSERASLSTLDIIKDIRLPLSMGAAAGIIIWGLISSSYIQRMRSTFNQALFNAKHQQDNQIEAGQHYSSYQAVRRLLLSDFGSGVRKGFLKPGSIASEIATNAKAYYTNWKDILTKSITELSSFAKELPSAIAAAINDDNGIARVLFDSKFRVFRIGAALGLVATLLPLAARSVYAEKGKDREDIEARKTRLKRLRNGFQSNRSRIRTPESNIREGYKLHTPFGSVLYRELVEGAFKAFLNLKPLEGGIEFMLSRWSRPDKFFKDTESMLTNILKLKRLGIADRMSSIQVVEIPETIIKKASRKATTVIGQNVTDARRIIELRKSKMNVSELKGVARAISENSSIAKGTESLSETLSDMFNVELREKKPRNMPVVVKKARTTKSRIVIDSFNVKNYSRVKSISIDYSKVLPELAKVPHTDTTAQLSPAYIKVPAHDAEAMSRIIQKKRLRRFFPPHEGISHDIMTYKAEIPTISMLRPASGQSAETAKTVKDVATIAKKLSVTGVETPRISAIPLYSPLDDMYDHAQHVSILMTEHTKRIARNYSYGGNNTFKFAQTINGR